MRLGLPLSLRAVATLAALAALAAFQPSDAEAQRRARGLDVGPVQAGLRAGRDFENRAWSLGGQVVVPIGERLELRPSGDLFFPRGPTGWQANGDAAIRIGPGGGIYGGGGVALASLDGGGSETGYNLFFGLSTASPRDRLKSFLEFRWTFLDAESPFRLAGGFNYVLGW